MNQNLEGIISSLGNKVDISAGGKTDLYSPVSNITKNDDSEFINCLSFDDPPSSEAESFIKFDFGPSLKVMPFSYLIRTNRGRSNTNAHAKTWRIEGSIDGYSWTIL